jgi:DNA mismatch repair protein MutL
MPIRILPEVVAAQIAAGEVIERPASVVKELVENALDAGAKRIEVEVEGGGLSLLRVSDDGQGIPAEEVALALVRHATSKLSTVQDLNNIQTLGFRGEALASTASVSRLTLTTCHIHENTGTRLVVEGGHLLDQRGIGAPAGTTVEVANLFYNVPARRKFLKSDTTERRHITNFIMRYAVAYPNVRFALYMDGNEAFRTSGSGDLAEVIVDTLGLEVFRDMLEVTPQPSTRPDLPPITVYGFTTNANQTRSNRSQIILFVNGRSIQDQRLNYAVVQAYHTMIPQGRFPVSVLMIDLPPEEVDVNVHPAKAEVRFRAPDAVFSVVQRTVRAAVMELGEMRSLSPAGFVPWDSPETDLLAPAPSTGPRVVDAQQLGLGLDSPDRGRRANQVAPVLWEEASLEHIPEAMGTPARPRSLPPMRVVGQVGATYIVAEGPAGLYLVDQHAAHERILYEQFMARHAASEKMVQHTLETNMVELAPGSARLLEEHISVLEALGFEVEPFGTNTFRVRAVPAPLADHDPAEVLRRIMDDLENGDTPGARNIEDKILRRVCKAAAVKAGQVLSYDEMQGIIRQLERCEHPLTCPHGRPTLIHMSANDLAREFGRT